MGNTADDQNQAVCVRRLEPLGQFLVNLFRFSALDVRSGLQATFDLVGKGHQRKRHDQSRHGQPESAVDDMTVSLQTWYSHPISTWLPLGSLDIRWGWTF